VILPGFVLHRVIQRVVEAALDEVVCCLDGKPVPGYRMQLGRGKVTIRP
jgi:hypothetical protein